MSTTTKPPKVASTGGRSTTMTRERRLARIVWIPFIVTLAQRGRRRGLNRTLAGVAVAVAGLTACGGSAQAPATSQSTVPPSASVAKAVTATQVGAAAGGTSCKSLTPPSGAVSAVTCTLPNGNTMNVSMFRQSWARDTYVSSNLQQFPGDAGYWVEGRPGTRWAIQFTSIDGGQADAQSVAVRVNGIQIGGQPAQ